MNILIKGMEMPREGELLSIDIYPDGKVCINSDLQRAEVAAASVSQALAELSNFPSWAISWALVYAKCLIEYGVSVEKEWKTVVQQYNALQKAYIRGRSDEAERWRRAADTAPTIILPSEEKET